MNTRITGAGFFLSVALIACAPLLISAQTTPTSVQERAALQAELDRIERDIANNQGALGGLRERRTTLERDIAILDNKIKTAQLQIKQSDLTLSKLHGDISTKVTAIRQVDTSVSKSQASLAQLLRRTREVDDIPLAMLALSAGSISDLFEEMDAFETIERALDASFTEMARLRTDLSERKRSLEEKEDETQKVRQAQVIARQNVQKDEKEKQSILIATKGQEKAYQQLIADKQKQAAAIRAALFGLRDSGAIPFGTAYEYAKAASAGTGVRAALILAILTQESDLGQNVGACYVTNLETGSGVGKNTGRSFSKVMAAPRDTVPFRTITETLARDPSKTPVSCPQSVGYGGAMGPAQFIPSTWMLYKDRLARLTGETFPDPWIARTAIFATALLMEDNGADGGVRASERKAALKYFAGSNWAKPANAVYGDSVMELADDIQAQINILEGR
ncbi:MAG: hypothetical protein AAB665_02190 [Patescibacteria group bacterium]